MRLFSCGFGPDSRGSQVEVFGKLCDVIYALLDAVEVFLHSIDEAVLGLLPRISELTATRADEAVLNQIDAAMGAHARRAAALFELVGTWGLPPEESAEANALHASIRVCVEQAAREIRAKRWRLISFG